MFASGKRCSSTVWLRFLLLLPPLLLLFQLSTCLDPAPAAVGKSVSVSPVQHTSSSNYNEGMDGAGEWRREVLFPAEDPIRRLLQPYGWPLLHSPETSRRKLLQTPGAAVPFSPLKVVSNGKPCILFRSRKLAIRYQNSSLVDLTERTFSAENPVDTKGSVCTKDKATLVMKFGDVEDLRGLSIRIQMSSTFYESAGQTWFSVDSVSLHYNWSQEARFNVTEVYAPSTSSYHCQHVSSLQRYDTLLLPSSASDNARHWHVTFTDFQIQAFNVASGKFAPASDCATFFTPAILMGLITSLILLLVLAYALHMVIHLKHIDHYDEHKTTVYFPRSPEQAEPCSVANVTEKNTL